MSGNIGPGVQTTDSYVNPKDEKEPTQTIEPVVLLILTLKCLG